MLKKINILLYLVFCFVISFSQEEKKHKFIFSFDSRNTVILGQSAGLFGVKFGIEHNKRHRFGMGIYAIKANSTINLGKEQIEYSTENNTLRDTIVDLYAGFDYLTLFYEYVWLTKKRWEISTPVSFGYGTASVNYNIGKQKIIYADVPVLSVEPVVSGHYKVFSWIGIGAGVGYRKVVYTNKKIGHRLDAPLYIFKIKLFLGGLLKTKQ
ncbi:MAG TPA: hypothetical protein DIU39_01310 [Flavobacteriales bacterium]|nr:hypothetical protein [Flavobacteriales bacterium]